MSIQYNPTTGDILLKRYILTVLAVLCVVLPAQAVDRHVALTGSDTNPGTLLMPYRTISKALQSRMPGDPIFLHAGTHLVGRGSSVIIPVDVKPWQGEAVSLQMSDGAIVPLSLNTWIFSDDTLQTRPDVKLIVKAGGRFTDVRVMRRSGDTSRTVFITVNRSTVLEVVK